jgi:hypothetical protein
MSQRNTSSGHRLAAIAALGFAFAACASWQPAESRRTVRVNVTVQAPAGTPVPSIAVSLATGKGAAVARTDANGKVTLVGTADLIDTVVPIVLSPITAGGFYAERTQDIERYEAVVGAHAFERSYPLQLASGVEDYTLTITGPTGVSRDGTSQHWRTACANPRHSCKYGASDRVSIGRCICGGNTGESGWPGICRANGC